jgi:ribosome recycling factor
VDIQKNSNDMNEDIQLQLEMMNEGMHGAIHHLEAELVKLRAGKANPHMLDGIKVDYYGSITPLSQVANVGTQDAQTIVIQPWDKKMIDIIEKEIQKANLGFNPMNNGDLIRINVPALTEERRRDLVKVVKTEAEHCKVSIRNARREAIDGLKKLKENGLAEDDEKRAEVKVQNSTDEFIKKVDEVVVKKEAEIMTV